MIESSPFAKPIVAAAVLAVLWLIEGIAPMFEGRRKRALHDGGNLVLGVGNAAIAALVFAAATLWITEAAREREFGLLPALGITGPARIALAVVLFDLWQYVWHRLNHRVPFLWRFHAVHHSDRELDATSGFRFHTGEILFSSLARLAVLPLIGMTVFEVVVYELILLPIILFHHSNIRLPGGIDRALRWLIVTPWMHWVHHSEYQPETDSNYASIFSFWDRLFRSFRLRNDPGEIRLGLEDMEREEWATLPGMLAAPFRRRSPRRESAAERGRGSGSG